MKSLLFVIPTMRVGGAEKSLVSLLQALDPERVQVDLLLFEGGGVLQNQLPDWVRVIEADPVTRGMILEIRYYLKDVAKESIPAAISRLWMTVRSSMRKKLRFGPRFSWDTVKKHIPKLDKHYDVAIGYLEGFTDFYVIDKVDAGRKIGWIHTDISSVLHAEEETAYYSQFQRIVTITEKCRSAIIQVYPFLEDKTLVLPNLVSREEIERKANESVGLDHVPGGFEIVTVGRLEYVKGIDIAADACRLLIDRQIPVRWRVYGDGSCREELETRVDRLSLKDSFSLCGEVPNPYPYIKAADILVQPSRWEGKSVVLDEAKLLGKAIVVTDYPSVTDQICHGENGWIVEMTPEALADGIECVLRDAALRARLEKACQNMPDETCEILERFYRLIEE